MPKKILQDIITTNKTTRGLSVHSNKNKKTTHAVQSRRRQENTHDYNSKKNSPKFMMWFLALVSVLFLLFLLLSVFSGTMIEVVPVQKQISLEGKVLKAKKDASDKELPFKMIILKSSDSLKIPATEERNLEKKAFGDIVIYNAYSSRSQKLVGRTRFETKDGKIYRIQKPVVVPGTTVKDGKIVPGSVTATIYADVIGEKYNIGLADFTIPGFKGSARFGKFYARSKTKIDGGFSGMVKSASSKDIEKARISIESSLKETLLSQARSQVPNDFILYDDAVFFKFYNTTPQEVTSKDFASINQEGKLYGVIIDRNKLSKYIAENFISSYDGGAVTIPNLDKIKFFIVNKDKFDPESSNELEFKFSGIVDIVWKVDKKSLANSLAGKNKKDFNSIISKYPSIDKAKAIVRPFWKKEFSKNSADVVVKVINSSASVK